VIEMVNPLDFLPRNGKIWLGLLFLAGVISTGAWYAYVNYRNMSYLNLMLGCTPVKGVAESGFHFQEHNGPDPFRWTNGAAKLWIPVNARRPPQRLWINIETFRPKAGPVRFQILADGVAVFDGSAPLGKWEKTFDLSSQKFSDKVMIELRSETFVPKGVMDKGKNTDTRMLGVQVKGVILKRDAK
jgi:hypothetical protein